MDDFIARYRTQLVTARRRRRPHFSRPAVTVLVGIGLLAGGAAAATTPWSPDLGSDHPRDFAVDASPPPADQLRTLGVLRRAQTAADREVAQSYALRFFGGDTRAVRTDFVRTLGGGGAAGSAAVLVPVRTYQAQRVVNDASGKPVPVSATAHDGLCLFVGDSGAGGGQGCHSLADVEAGRVRGALGSIENARLFGLVPDGVAQVRVRRASTPPTLVTVEDNFYDITLAPTTSGAAVSLDGLDWLDREGRVLKTQEGWTIGGPRPHTGKIVCRVGRLVAPPPARDLDKVASVCDPARPAPGARPS
jgi:hypothetical protein